MHKMRLGHYSCMQWGKPHSGNKHVSACVIFLSKCLYGPCKRRQSVDALATARDHYQERKAVGARVLYQVLRKSRARRGMLWAPHTYILCVVLPVLKLLQSRPVSGIGWSHQSKNPAKTVRRPSHLLHTSQQSGHTSSSGFAYSARILDSFCTSHGQKRLYGLTNRRHSASGST
jgi:hypothetical protein